MYPKVKLIDTETLKKRKLIDAEADATSGTRPAPSAVTLKLMPTVAQEMPNALRLTDALAVTPNRNSWVVGF